MDRSFAEYLANLELRDEREATQRRFTESFSKIADRATKAEAKLRIIETTGSTADVHTQEAAGVGDVLSHLRNELSTTRAQLATAQTQNKTTTTTLTTMKSEMSTLRADLAAERQQREFFTKQATALDRKLKDRHSESRESRKLVDDVQNEMISLELQLSVAEQRSAKLEKENRELVERWMALKGEEAEKMNEQSRW